MGIIKLEMFKSKEIKVAFDIFRVVCVSVSTSGYSVLRFLVDKHTLCIMTTNFRS